MRLNTNESPLAAARRRGARSWPRPSAESTFNRYPDREATELRQAAGRQPRRRHRRGLLRQRVQRGAPVPAAGLRRARAARAPLFEPTYALHAPHRPDHRHRGGRRAGATTTSHSTSTWCAEVVGASRPGAHLPVLAQQPDRAGRAARRRWPRSLAWPRACVVVDEAYGQFAPSSALELRGRPTRRHRTAVVADLLQDLVHGRRPARLPGGRPRGGGRPASWWRCPTT